MNRIVLIFGLLLSVGLYVFFTIRDGKKADRNAILEKAREAKAQKALEKELEKETPVLQDQV